MERWQKPWIEQDQRTKNWAIRWREKGPDGKIHKRSMLAANYRDACLRRDIKAQELLSISTLTINPNAALSPLVDTYIRDREQIRKLRPGSIALKHRTLGRYLKEFKTIGQITRDSLVGYRDGLYTKYDSAVTVGIHFREIKAFVRWLYHEGKLEKNPFFNIEMPRQESMPHFITDDEILRIEKASSPKFLKIFRTAYLTGMRAGELLRAQWDQISWAWQLNPDTKKNERRAFITLEAQTTKTRRSRTIPLRREIVELIGRQKSGLIFGYTFHQNMHADWIAIKKNAGIEGRVRFHDLRHTFCRIYLQGGGTTSDLMTITGHQSLAMVQVYAHFESRWKSERIDAINIPTGLTGQIQGSDDGLSVIQGDSENHGETPSGGMDYDSSTRNNAAGYSDRSTAAQR